MLRRVDDLEVRWVALDRAATRAVEEPGLEAVLVALAEAKAFRVACNEVEGENITRALHRADYPFESAQAAVGRYRSRLVELLRTILAAPAGALLDAAGRSEVEEIVFLLERAPLSGRSTLEVIRQAAARLGRAPVGS